MVVKDICVPIIALFGKCDSASQLLFTPLITFDRHFVCDAFQKQKVPAPVSSPTMSSLWLSHIASLMTDQHSATVTFAAKDKSENNCNNTVVLVLF